MDKIADLELGRTTEMDQTVSSGWSEKSSRHEEQERAFAKIVNVLRREDREAAVRYGLDRYRRTTSD